MIVFCLQLSENCKISFLHGTKTVMYMFQKKPIHYMKNGHLKNNKSNQPEVMAPLRYTVSLVHNKVGQLVVLDWNKQPI